MRDQTKFRDETETSSGGPERQTDPSDTQFGIEIDHTTKRTYNIESCASASGGGDSARAPRERGAVQQRRKREHFTKIRQTSGEVRSEIER